MRHYFGYDARGNLVSTEMMAGGFPKDCALDEKICAHPIANQIKAIRAKENPEVVGFIAYDCECESGDSTATCPCVGVKRDRGRVVEGKLVDKPAPMVYIDGAIMVLNGDPIVKAPGSSLMLQFGLPGVETGEVVLVNASRSVTLTLALNNKTASTFTVENGKTAPIKITMPAQGLSGCIMVLGETIAPLRLTFTAFAQ